MYQREHWHCSLSDSGRSSLLPRLGISSCDCTSGGDLAQTDISFSNSLIESWWRALKHQWLFLNTFDTISRLKKLVAFYVDEHNMRLPHSAFRGQTLNEMYFGTGDRVPDELEAAKKVARLSRMDANRATSCPKCRPFELIPN